MLADEGLCGERNGAMRWSKKNCGGKRMMRPLWARRSQVDGGRKRAAVCSFPPSCVGAGIMVSSSSVSVVGNAEVLCDSGSR